MRFLVYAAVSFSLAVPAYVLSGGSAAAVEAPRLISKPHPLMTRVDDRDHERCEHVRHECRERHHDHEREYRECVERERCEP